VRAAEELTIAREPIACTTPDGFRLRGDLLLPPAPRAGAVLAHAMMTSRRSMDRPQGHGLASTLAGQGIAVLNFDLRAHGESGPSAREGASYAYDDFANRDLPTIVGFARTALPRLPLAVVGHSLGGHAALFAAALHPSAAPDGVAAIAANIWLPSLEPSLARRAAKRLIFASWWIATRARGYFDPRPFGLGSTAEAKAYIQQFVENYAADRFTSLDGRIDYLAALKKLSIPVLSISSEGDRLFAHPASVARFLSRIERADVTARVIRAADVGEAAPDHMELVTRASSRPIWLSIAAWVQKLRPAPAAGRGG
jgi:predicted alpha/beta hydrolase